MPAGYAHYVFGQKVLNTLDQQTKELIEKNIDLYNIGIHGPDILFYYDAYKSNKIAKLGNHLHELPAYTFFEHAKEVIEQSDDKDASLAYVYGFICHYMLDHACHPYIYQLQKDLSMTHSEIESELDRKILVNEGKNPLTSVLTNHIHTNEHICKTIAPFFNLTDEEINKSLKDLLFYLEWIRCPGKIKRGFVHAVLKIGGIYKEYSGLIINYKENPKSSKEIDHLIELLNGAVVNAKEAIESFDQPLDQRYHYNFESNQYID